MGRKPTIKKGLTILEKRLLEYLLEPENRFKSIVKMCEELNIDRKAYYKAFHNEIFLKQYKQESYNITKQAVAPVINACVKQAKAGSFKHAELLLKMSGMIEDTRAPGSNNDEATKARAVSVNVFVDALKGAAAEVWKAPIIDGKPAKEGDNGD